MYVRYHHHGQEVKKFVDFHLLMRMFVLAQRPQMSFFPSDVKWIGDTLLVKRNFIEEALDDVFQKWGYSLQEREAMMDDNHLVARLLRILIRNHFEVVPSALYNQWESRVPNWMLTLNHWYLPKVDWRRYDPYCTNYFCHVLIEQQII